MQLGELAAASTEFDASIRLLQDGRSVPEASPGVGGDDDNETGVHGFGFGSSGAEGGTGDAGQDSLGGGAIDKLVFDDDGQRDGVDIQLHRWASFGIAIIGSVGRKVNTRSKVRKTRCALGTIGCHLMVCLFLVLCSHSRCPSCPRARCTCSHPG